MMKITKRILSVMIAALMLVMMIPVAASAATETVNFTVECDKAGYEFTVYQLAALDTATGAYAKNAATSDAIFALIKGADKTSADILAACDAAATGIGTATGDVFTSGGAAKTYSVASGIYYIKATKAPATVKSVTNSVVALPYYNGSAWVKTIGAIKLAEKVKDGDVDVTKEITNSKFTGVKTYTTAEQDETVSFKLTASVVGSAEKKLQSYKITDTMGEGLTFSDDVTVTLTGEGLSDKTVTDFTVNKGTGKFEVVLGATVLADASFYDYTTVEVACSAKLNANAVIGSAGNTNKDELTYKNADGIEATVNGDTVKVYTFNLTVKKVDAADASKALSGAEFKVYKSKEDAAADKNDIATAATGADGIAKFSGYKFDQNKTYYIKETKAPADYNLNSSIIEIKTPAATFDASGNLTAPADGVLAYSTAITNTKSKLPQTGGEGTLMFTVIGGSLVLLAAALFIVVMKKRSSAK